MQRVVDTDQVRVIRLGPVVVVRRNPEERKNRSLEAGLESLRESIDTGRGVYWSRKRGLWRKGETSGATQELVAVAVDCDRDALRFTVRQAGSGFCQGTTPTGTVHSAATSMLPLMIAEWEA